MIRINANLFRIAYACVSKEETRYYLNGVYVEPHPQGGVTLTTTDGHRLLSLYDENGFADESAIIRLDVKLCKSKRYYSRFISIETGSDSATILEGTGDVYDPDVFAPVATEYKVRIDGTFPDYRRCVPQTPDMANLAAPNFNGSYVGDFGAVGRELSIHFNAGKTGTMRVLSSDASGPCLILWPAVSQAFGVLMPMRAADTCDAPSWFRNPQPAAPSLAPAEQDHETEETQELENA